MGIVFVVTLVILAVALEIFVVVLVVVLNRCRDGAQGPFVRNRLPDSGVRSLRAKGSHAGERRHDQDRGGHADRRQTGQDRLTPPPARQENEG
ncbi:MAG TPA: hypothetical protein VEW45_05810 [Candidatus Dormibacteraeota bacterium]|nr:hypothetical protein [Candidatus Dormibacteraeota bacterium]